MALSIAYVASLTSNNVQVSVLSGAIVMPSGLSHAIVDVMARNSQTCSNFTYNAVAATKIGTILVGAGELTRWRVDAPPSGSHTAEATFSGACYCVASVQAVTDAGSFGTAATANGSSTTPSVTIASAVGQIVLAAIARAQFAGSYNWVAPATELDPSGTPGGDTTAGRGWLLTGQEAGAASVTIDATCSASDTWLMLATSVLPISAGHGPLLAGRRNSLLAKVA